MCVSLQLLDKEHGDAFHIITCDQLDHFGQFVQTAQANRIQGSPGTKGLNELLKKCAALGEEKRKGASFASKSTESTDTVKASILNCLSIIQNTPLEKRGRGQYVRPRLCVLLHQVVGALLVGTLPALPHSRVQESENREQEKRKHRGHPGAVPDPRPPPLQGAKMFKECRGQVLHLGPL